MKLWACVITDYPKDHCYMKMSRKGFVHALVGLISECYTHPRRLFVDYVACLSIPFEVVLRGSKASFLFNIEISSFP